MTAPRVIKLNYKPRNAFKTFHARSQKKAVLVAHRRCGKTVAAVNDLVTRALRINTAHRKRPHYAYICPELKQAKQVSWDYLKEAVQEIPGVKVSESELYVRLPNGAQIRLYGADHPDSLRGMYFDGVILDEFGDMKASEALQAIIPALSDREGWIVYMGTPKGKNDFYDKVKEAKGDPEEWFFLSLKASETGYLKQDVLDDARENLGEDLYQQEYECSFEAANIGSYFGKHMIALESKGAYLPHIELDLSEKVSLAMDIGHRDATAIWFWQIVNGEVRFIDYWEETGWDAEELVEMLQLKPYNYETWWLPHDARSRTFQTKKSVLDTFRAYDAPARLVPDLYLKDGIDAVRKTLRLYSLQFDLSRCERGIEALRNYSRKWDMDRKIFSDSPSHDQWSHGADAFRYACLAITPDAVQRSVERAQARARAPQAHINIGSADGRSHWTFAQAFEERERQARRKAMTPTRRI